MDRGGSATILWKKNDSMMLIDLLKLFFAIEIVAGHAGYIFKNVIIRQLISYVGGAGLPFFFMTSGYLLGNQIADVDCDKLSRSVARTTKNMLRRYFVWSVLGFPWAVYEFVVWKTGILKGILFYLRDAVFRGEHFQGAPTWYILSSIYTLILIYVILEKFKNVIYVYIMVPVALVLYYCINYITCAITPGSLLECVINNTLGMFRGRIFMGFWTIPLGIMIAQFKSQIKSVYAWGMLPFVSILRLYIVSDVGDLLLIFNLLICVLSINAKGNSLSIGIRRISTMMYFSHMFFISILLMLNSEMNKDCVFYYALFFSTWGGIVAHICIEKNILKKFWTFLL